jgi:hypothetical protein
MIITEEPSKYKIDLVEIQDGVGTGPRKEYILF